MIQVFTIYNNEENILQAIAAGEKKGLEWLYKHCFDTTEKMIIKFGGDKNDAWDIFQEAVTIFYEKCSTDGIELNCRINTYITSITKNLWIKKTTTVKNKTVELHEELHEEVAHSETDVDVFLQKEKDLLVLEKSLELLGEPCNKMMKAFYFEKKSMQEICTAFGYTNTENAKTQKYKCLARLKKIFFNSTT